MDTVPIRQLRESFRKETDIEPELHSCPINVFFLDGQQIDEQCRQSGPIKDIRHIPVARAQPAASAAMGKHHEPLRIIRDCEIAGEIGLA